MCNAKKFMFKYMLYNIFYAMPLFIADYMFEYIKMKNVLVFLRPQNFQKSLEITNFENEFGPKPRSLILTTLILARILTGVTPESIALWNRPLLF